jgi:hypothetical protein
MVMFWVLIFRDIIQKMASNDGKLPSANLSLDIAKEYQQILGPDVWMKHYTERLMLDPKTALHWRLPDIRRISAPATARYCIPQVFHFRDDDNDRVLRFAFATVKSYMGIAGPSRRWIVEQALAVLQTAIIRTRSTDSTITPFSETQAYFWIEYMHTILNRLPYFVPKMDSRIPRLPSVQDLEFDDLLGVGLAHPSLWRGYYSFKTWYSMEARVNRVQPDLKALVFHFDLPSLFLLDSHVTDHVRPELPSEEELTLFKVIAEKQIQNPNLTLLVHSHLLYMMFCELVYAPNLENREECIEQVTSSFAKKGDSLTSIPFWTKLLWERLQTRLPSTIQTWRNNTNKAFTELISSNTDLLHEKLWKGSNSFTEKLSNPRLVGTEVEVEAEVEKEAETQYEKDDASTMSMTPRMGTPMSELSEATDADTLALKSQNKDWEFL